MSLAEAVRQSAQPWRLVVCAAVAGFLALGVATHTFRVYHLFMLLAIPAALFASELGRRFFVEWGPLMATWLAYDRFRLVQPSLLSRVGVEWPYRLEVALFGWLTGGQAPPHAARAWLAAHSASPFWSGVAIEAQVIYVSHLFFYPLLFLVWWIRGWRRPVDRARFLRHVVAFATLNVLGFVGYLLLPAAPPWWVSLNGMAQPTQALVATANLAAAMDGAIIQKTLQTAPNWFAAIPSLHGGYPVLLFMLGWRERNGIWLTFITLYGAAMWTSTVLLNQHYVVDLMAGAVVAVVAFQFTEWLHARGILQRFGGASCHDEPDSRSL